MGGSLGEAGGGQLPTVEIAHLSLEIDPAVVVAELGRKPQRQLVQELFEESHFIIDFYGGIANLSLGTLYAHQIPDYLPENQAQERSAAIQARGFEVWDEATLARILLPQRDDTAEPHDTRNLEEEEFFRATRLREGVSYLAWTVLGVSNLPEDIKNRFYETARAKDINNSARGRYYGPVAEARVWLKEHAELDTPVTLTPEVIERTERICLRMQRLVDFYNRNDLLRKHFHRFRYNLEMEPDENGAPPFHRQDDRVDAIYGFLGTFLPSPEAAIQSSTFYRELGWPMGYINNLVKGFVEGDWVPLITWQGKRNEFLLDRLDERLDRSYPEQADSHE